MCLNPGVPIFGSIDLARGTETRLTTDPADDRAPLWTLDGKRVVFESNRAGSVALFSKLVDAPGEPERLMMDTSGVTVLEATSWSPDGQTLAFHRAAPVDIGLLSMEDDRTVQMLLDTEFTEAAPTISPDGNWIAYHSDETRQDEVYVQRFPSLGDMWVFPLLKSLLPVVVAFLLPTTDTLDHRRVGNGTHRHGLFQEPMEELPAMA